MIAGELGENANGAGIGADRQLGRFQRNDPPLFKGTHDPEGAQKWLKEIERIFIVIDCAENLKVRYDTHMLSEEADDWLIATKTELDTDGITITWAVFKKEFMRKYFPEDVRGRKEIKFLELKQDNMTVPEYVAKFVELAKYYTPYNNDEAAINADDLAMTARQVNEAVKDGATNVVEQVDGAFEVASEFGLPKILERLRLKVI
ncbi:uncharacterized protein LOC131614358 [Vicia villosa]|uniref:uncharacterized protein LOC131614358 n=1 Tax=Vicia villosa TaxID=3911 RepID=UPI00273B2178|nr:uncharacterized protein LOC131614358 [Vicia villosa]